ncbi:hypothetical protein ACFVVP_26350 [Streptomyces sp. NPDC058128]|uniref:hypothetical protein n=1 Tax=Streptomyces sp. NPDC058128 TaxID=3346352 RepID=UPI0036F07AFB
MDGLWKYLVENPEILGALVAAFIGSLGGGWVQAKGGHAQAKAAQKAAEIAAEAQRVAALWTVRHVQMAEFIQLAREVQRVTESFYSENETDGSLTLRVNEAQDALFRKQAEIDLIVPNSVVQAAIAVVDCLTRLVTIEPIVGQAEFFRVALSEVARGNDRGAAQRAREAESALQAWHRAGDSDDRDALTAAYTSASEAVREAIAVTDEQVAIIMASSTRSHWPWQRDQARGALSDRSLELLTAAREMLKSEDDLAPAVQRRWWRRNSTAATADSA